MKKENKRNLNMAIGHCVDVQTEMITALNSIAREICRKEGAIIDFDDEIDNATSDAIYAMGYDNENDKAFITDADDNHYGLDELTCNELYELCNRILVGEYTEATR